MITVQQCSPGWGYFMDVLEELLSGKEFLMRRYEASKTLTEMVSDAHVLILGTAKISKEVLDAAPRLKLIQQHGRGVDGVDLAYATKKRVYVCNVPGENATSVAEQAMLLILALAKKYKACERSFRNRILGSPPTMELKGKTVGIVGLGATGKELARISKAFGMRVLAVTEHPEAKTKEDRGFVDFLGGADQFDYLLKNSDYISIHVPLNERTRGMVNRAWFDKMKPTAYLINIARGAIIDKASLLDALVHNRIAGAGFDVFWEYPPDPQDPLFQLENVAVTPHMAGFSAEVYERMGKIVADNILRVAREQTPLHVVNEEVIQTARL